MLPVLQSQPGDGDNRCTIHAATGFDHERYTCAKWRQTLPDGAQGESLNQRP